jgi:hypothetical protein
VHQGGGQRGESSGGWRSWGALEGAAGAGRRAAPVWCGGSASTAGRDPVRPALPLSSSHLGASLRAPAPALALPSTLVVLNTEGAKASTAQVGVGGEGDEVRQASPARSLTPQTVCRPAQILSTHCIASDRSPVSRLGAGGQAAREGSHHRTCRTKGSPATHFNLRTCAINSVRCRTCWLRRALRWRSPLHQLRWRPTVTRQAWRRRSPGHAREARGDDAGPLQDAMRAAGLVMRACVDVQPPRTRRGSLASGCKVSLGEGVTAASSIPCPPPASNTGTSHDVRSLSVSAAAQKHLLVRRGASCATRPFMGRLARGECRQTDPGRVP